MSYSPVLGRWLEPDPTGPAYIDGMNLDQAFDSNPVDRLDPTGTKPVTLTFGTFDEEAAATASAANPATNPTNGPTTAPATWREVRKQQTRVKLSTGGMGLLTIEWQNFITQGPTDQRSGVKVKFTFVSDTNARDCDANLKWYQSIQSKVENQRRFGLDQADLQDAYISEKKDHGGHSPFDGVVGDNSTGLLSEPYPFQSTDAVKDQQGVYATTRLAHA